MEEFVQFVPLSSEAVNNFLAVWSTKSIECSEDGEERCIRFHCTNISYKIFLKDNKITQLHGDQYPLVIVFSAPVSIFRDTEAMIITDGIIQVCINKYGCIKIS